MLEYFQALLQIPIESLPSELEAYSKTLFENDPENPSQIVFLLNELDSQLAHLSTNSWIFPRDNELQRLLLIIKEAFKVDKYLKAFNSLEHLTQLLILTDDFSSISLILEVLFKLLSQEGLDIKQNKVEIMRIAYLGKFFFLNINSHFHNSKARFHDFFSNDENFMRLKSNLKEYEREVYNIEQNHHEFIFEFSFPNKETLSYDQLIKPLGKPEFLKQEFRNFKALISHEKPCLLLIEALISEYNLPIKPKTPLFDALLIRLKFDKILRNPLFRSKILDIILKSSWLNSNFLIF